MVAPDAKGSSCVNGKMNLFLPIRVYYTSHEEDIAVLTVLDDKEERVVSVKSGVMALTL